MNSEHRYILLANLVKEVEEDPTFFGDVVNACNAGVIQSRENAYARACDMETVLISVCEMHKKGQRNKSGHRALAADLLNRYRNKTAMAFKAYEEYFPELKEEKTDGA